MIPKIVAPKACTHSSYGVWSGELIRFWSVITFDLQREKKKRQESCRFEDDYEYEIFSILGTATTRQPSLFWLENVIAVVREGLTSFSINNRINFFDEKKKKLNEAFWGVFF